MSGGGLLTFITSNSWMQAASGAKLRRHFLRYNPRMLVNMGVDVFDNASVDTCILMVENAENRGELLAADTFRLNEFPPSEWVHISPQNDDAWVIFSLTEQHILSKIKEAGTPIKDWDVQIFRGLTTGYDDAFVIDEHTKHRLCKQDPKSGDIIMPMLRGRDISRYGYRDENLWIITTFPSKKLDIDDYPAVKKHLLSFMPALEQSGERGCRKKTPHAWFETSDTIAYYPPFSKKKLVWRDISSQGCFAFDAKKVLYACRCVYYDRRGY